MMQSNDTKILINTEHTLRKVTLVRLEQNPKRDVLPLKTMQSDDTKIHINTEHTLRKSHSLEYNSYRIQIFGLHSFQFQRKTKCTAEMFYSNRVHMRPLLRKCAVLVDESSPGSHQIWTLLKPTTEYMCPSGDQETFLVLLSTFMVSRRVPCKFQTLKVSSRDVEYNRPLDEYLRL